MIFILIGLITIVLIMAIIGGGKKQIGRRELSQSNLYYRTNTPASKIYQALETINILQNTKKYDTFTSRFAFLLELSESIVKYQNCSCYEDYVNTAIQQYKQTYKTNKITLRQKDFIANPDMTSNHSFSAKLKARFFIDFCEAMQDEMNKLKTEASKQRKRNFVKDVAVSMMQELKANGHLALANGIVDDAAKLGVLIDRI